jgi:hypothetical protein
MFSSAIPRLWSSRTVKRIITSGPQIIATVLRELNCALEIKVVTTPTLPDHVPAARSTVTWACFY